jgi:hypothetical protein
MTLNKLMPHVEEWNVNEMTNFLRANHVEYCRDAVEWTTVDYLGDVVEIDAWLDDDIFLQMFYDIEGNLTRYEFGD